MVAMLVGVGVLLSGVSLSGAPAASGAAPSSSSAAASPPSSTQPIMDVLTRVVSPTTAAIFELKLDPSMKQGFRMANAAADAPAGALISVTASGLPELAYGAAYYLRTHANMNFAWQWTGGFQTRVPAGGFPKLTAPVALSKKVKWSYYQNVCTQSYTMWYWTWERWEQELDWAALWGINIMLAYTGQEAQFKEVYNSIGVNDSVLNQTFNGPAFLTWSRGQGSFGFGAPLPDFWMSSQHDLQIKIMNRLRELDMEGILPGFQGNVPKAMKEIFPTANTSNGWLDALDPLFDTIATKFNTKSQKDFGPAHFIEADGWFSLETGPWLSASSSEALAPLGQDIASMEEDRATHPDCLNGFVLPTEEEAASRVAKVFASLTTAQKDNTWVYQGYPWFRVWAACPANREQLRNFVKGFASAVPRDKLLVLDLIADSPSRALWRYPPSPTLGPFAQNISLIWCSLSNWGGAVHVGGDLDLVLSETRAAMATPNVVGTGLTPEGIDNNPAFFSLVIDSAWTMQPTAESWLEEWGRGRCGAVVPEAQQAYALLYKTIYMPGTPYLFCCAKPVFCPTVMPGQKADRAAYNVTVLRQALELMVVAAPKCNTEAFNYDLVDVAREWLSYGACIEKLDAIKTNAPPAELKSTTEAFLDVTDDIDTMLKTNRGFLLGAWLNGSRSVADWDGSDGKLGDLYEWNGRVQVTTWAGRYSRREWSGMVKGYYQERTRIWLNATLQAHDDALTEHGLLASSTTSTAVAGKYTAVEGFDCNFDDLGPKLGACKSKGQKPGTPACLQTLETLCGSEPTCIGFNWPHGIFKTGCPACSTAPPCSGWEPSTGNTFYFKPGHGPPPGGQPTSSCIDKFCYTQLNGTGTHNGTGCDKACPAKPAPPDVAKLLTAFDDDWSHRRWSNDVDPASPVGDPVATAKQMLAKYK